MKRMRKKQNGREQTLEDVKQADLEVKKEILQEAVRVASAHGNAEELLRDLMRNVSPDAKQAAVVGAVSSEENAEAILSEAVKQAPSKVKKEVATKVVETLPANATDAKKEIATKAVQNASDEEAKKEVVTSAVEALPEDATGAKKDVAAKVVESLPGKATEAKKEIAKEAVRRLPTDAIEAKKEVVEESLREVSPESRDYLIADLVTMRRLVKRVILWTTFGAFAVAIVVALFAFGTALWGLEQSNYLLWVIIPVTTFLLGYGYGRVLSERADIEHLKKQNSGRSHGGMVNSNTTSRS